MNKPLDQKRISDILGSETVELNQAPTFGRQRAPSSVTCINAQHKQTVRELRELDLANMSQPELLAEIKRLESEIENLRRDNDRLRQEHHRTKDGNCQRCGSKLRHKYAQFNGSLYGGDVCDKCGRFTVSLSTMDCVMP